MRDLVWSARGGGLLRIGTSTEFVVVVASAEARARVEGQLLQARRGEALQLWFTEIYEDADIQDHRYRFYSY